VTTFFTARSLVLISLWRKLERSGGSEAFYIA